MDRLRDRTALITGAGNGIGRAIAQRFAAEGARVAVTDRDAIAGRRVVREIRAAGGAARFWKMDVAEESQVRTVTTRVIAAWDRIDVLVNNAGIMGTNTPTHLTRDRDWNAVMAVNVSGVFHCTKAVIPHMMAAGSGCVINIAGVYGTVGAPNAPAYHASKGAVALMTKTDALMYANCGIRVNSVHPSFVQTGMLAELLTSMPDVDPDQLITMHPLGRLGQPDDIAAGALYLASDDAAFVTGTGLVIDGGYTCR